MARRSRITIEPRLLNLASAASYCGLNIQDFSDLVPIRPIDIRDHIRYDRFSIDNWIDAHIQSAASAELSEFSVREPGDAGFTLNLSSEVEFPDHKNCRGAKSFGDLVAAYTASPDFGLLRGTTQKDYNRVLAWLANKKTIPLNNIQTSTIYAWRDEAFAQRKRRFANYVIQVSRLVLEWGKSHGFISQNVARGVKGHKRPSNLIRANRPWSDDEREAVLNAAPIELRLVIALGMFAGLRESDACVLRRDAFDGESIEVIAAKNGESVCIPVHFRLKRILQEAEQVRTFKLERRARRRKTVLRAPETLAVNSRGNSWTASGFRASFFKLTRKLAASGVVKPGLTFHGLRHTLGKLILEADGSKEDVGMILGDRSLAMASFYSREHDKKRRASSAMKRVENAERSRLNQVPE